MILICLLTLVFLYDIPKIQPLPASPRFILLGLVAMTFIHRRKALARSIAALPLPVYIFFALVFVIGCLHLKVRSLVVPIEGILYFCAVFSLVSSTPEKAVRFTRFVTILLLVSVLWFLGSIFLHEPFMSIRQIIYEGHVARFEDGLRQMLRPTGLTFNHSTMGYQISAGMVLAPFLFIAEKGRWRFFWAVASVIMLAGFIYIAQRSAIPAIAVAFAVAVIRAGRIKHLIVVSLLAGFAFLLIGIVASKQEDSITVHSRVETVSDTKTRLGWQVAAVKVIAKHPLGNIMEDLDWVTESVAEGADYSYYDWAVKAVHNTYLGEMLQYGWLGVIIVIWVMLSIFTKYIRLIIKSDDKDLPNKLYGDACAYAFISLTVQAFFHNAGIFNLEPSSWIVLSLCAGWAAQLKIAMKQTPTNASLARVGSNK